MGGRDTLYVRNTPKTILTGDADYLLYVNRSQTEREWGEDDDRWTDKLHKGRTRRIP